MFLRASGGVAAASLLAFAGYIGFKELTSSQENIFGFTVPQSIEKLEEALLYVNNQFGERYDGDFQTDKFRVTPKSWFDPNPLEDPKEKPDFWLVIKNVAIPADFQEGKKELASQLRKLFYKPQWDICQLKLVWDIAKAPNAVISNPQGQDVWGQMGIDREETYKTPKCKQ